MSDTILWLLSGWIFLGLIALWFDLDSLGEDLDDLPGNIYLAAVFIWLFYFLTGAFALWYTVRNKLKKRKKG